MFRAVWRPWKNDTVHLLPTLLPLILSIAASRMVSGGANYSSAQSQKGHVARRNGDTGGWDETYPSNLARGFLARGQCRRCTIGDFRESRSLCDPGELPQAI
jgi:hypothetical protein